MMKRVLVGLLVFLLAGQALGQSFVEAIEDLPEAMSAAMVEAQRQELVNFIEPFLDASKTFILSNPDPSGLVNYWQLMVQVISAFYILLFLVAGLKFVLGAYDSHQREEAKEWFKNALFVVIVLNASYLLYTVLLDVGSAIALEFWSSDFESLFTFASIESLNLFSLYYLSFTISLLWFTLFARYALLLIGVIAFPIGVFLFFVPPLKPYGSAILNLFGIAVFLQLIDVFALIVANGVLDVVGGPDFAFLVPSTTFLVMFLINLTMLLLAAVKGITSVKAYSPNIANVVNYVTPPSSYLSPVERAPSYYKE